MIFLLLLVQRLPRQSHGAVQSNREAAVAAADHDDAEDQLGSRMPRTSKAVGVGRGPDTDADAAVRRDDLEDDVEDAVVDRVGEEVTRVDGDDDEDGEDKPPDIVSQLPVYLLGDEVDVGLVTLLGRGCSGADTMPGRGMADCSADAS